MVHVQFEGCSYALDERTLKLTGFAYASDNEIKRHLARHCCVSLGRFDDYVVDRQQNGDSVVRPTVEYALREWEAIKGNA